MLIRPHLSPADNRRIQAMLLGNQNGDLRQQLLDGAPFLAELTHTAVPQRAAPGTTTTFTRATTKRIPDHEGVLRTLIAGELGFPGARREYNLWGTASSTLANGANNSMTLPAGAYQFSMGAGTGTATFSGTGGATGTLAASASGRAFVAKTITAGTLVVTASVADLVDLQVVSMVGCSDQTIIREYVPIGVESAPAYHGSMADGVKCFDTDLAGNALPTAYTYDAVSLNGVAGTYVSTPDSVANSITGDIDIRVKAALTDWTGVATTILSKRNTDAAYRLYITSGLLRLEFSLDGTALIVVDSGISIGLSANELYWVRVTRNATTGSCVFYKSSDGVAWSAINTLTGTSGLLFDSSAALEIASTLGGGTQNLSGKIYQAQIYNGIDGTLAVDFDASRYAGGTTLTGSTGETWTLQGNAVIHPTNSPMLGYQAEGARTNLITQSQTFSTWTTSNSSIAISGVSPSGASDAIVLTRGTSASVAAYIRFASAQAISSAYTVSIYAKAGTDNFIYIRNLALEGTNGTAYFNVSTGTVGALGANITLASIRSVGNGWYRCVVTGTTPGAITSNLIDVATVSADSVISGTANTGSCYIYGAQLELGSFASSHIATTTAAVTRNADIESVSTSGNITAAAGSIYLEYTPTHTPSGTIALWGTYVDASNYTAILHDATNLIFRKRIAGSNYDATIANAFVSGTTYKVAATWGAAGTSIALDGTLGTGHANTTAAQIAATMQFGADGNSLQQPFASVGVGYIGQRQLSASEMQAITS